MSKTVRLNKVNKDFDVPRLKITQFSFTTNSCWDNPNRTAPYWRLYWSKTPGAYIIFDGRKLELTEDKVILLAPNIRYASYSLKPFKQFYIHFEWDISPVPVEPLEFSSQPMKKLLSTVEDWFEEPGELFTVRMLAILFSYLAEIPETRTNMRHIDPRISEALLLIDRDLKLSNADISREVNMSRDNFQRVFKRETGLSPCQYRMGRRMEHAQQLLQNAELNMDDIALECGFMNRYQFSKTYKSFFKTTPAADRKKGLSEQ